MGMLEVAVISAIPDDHSFMLPSALLCVAARILEILEVAPISAIPEDKPVQSERVKVLSLQACLKRTDRGFVPFWALQACSKRTGQGFSERVKVSSLSSPLGPFEANGSRF